MGIIYITENLFNKQQGIMPYRYIGSDHNNDPNYFGSNKELREDIKKYGISYFKKDIIEEFIDITNKELRKIESDKYLKPLKVKSDPSYYNKSESYSPGCGQKGMKHTKKFNRTEKWKQSRQGYKPSIDTIEKFKKSRVGKNPGEETRKKMSIRSQGENNPNALQWTVTDPDGNVFKICGLRKWSKDNGVKYMDIYLSKNGWIGVKNGHGKGGRRKKEEIKNAL